MLFYKHIQPLSSEQHKDLVLYPAKTLEFCANTHWVPMAANEFAAASRSLPIIFVREGEGEATAISPIALLGLSLGHNDFLDERRSWEHDSYIPAFIRRYPFVPAAANEQAEQLTICIDESAPQWGKPKDDSAIGHKLFDEAGKPTAFLDEMVNFLQGYQIEMQRTKLFVDKLKEYDLLTSRNAEIHGAGGSVFQIADMLVVDEEKLNALEADKLKDLAQNGVMGWIYAHLLSLNNLPALLALHNKQVNKPVAGNA